MLLFSALAFVWLNKKGIYPPELNAVHLDFDWSYRRLLPRLSRPVARTVVLCDQAVRRQSMQVNKGLIHIARRIHGPGGILAREVGTSTMVTWVTVLLAVYLVLSLV